MKAFWQFAPLTCLMLASLLLPGLPMAAGTVQKTAVSVFAPTAPKGPPRSGECWTDSIAVARSGVWRCMLGNEIHDPCFTSPGLKGAVICDADPARNNPGFIVKLTKPLPTPSSRGTAGPAAMAGKTRGRNDLRNRDRNNRHGRWHRHPLRLFGFKTMQRPRMPIHDRARRAFQPRQRLDRHQNRIQLFGQGTEVDQPPARRGLSHLEITSSMRRVAVSLDESMANGGHSIRRSFNKDSSPRSGHLQRGHLMVRDFQRALAMGHYPLAVFDQRFLPQIEKSLDQTGAPRGAHLLAVSLV